MGWLRRRLSTRSRSLASASCSDASPSTGRQRCRRRSTTTREHAPGRSGAVHVAAARPRRPLELGRAAPRPRGRVAGATRVDAACGRRAHGAAARDARRAHRALTRTGRPAARSNVVRVDAVHAAQEAGRVHADAMPLEPSCRDGRQGHVHVRWRDADEEVLRGDGSSTTGRTGRGRGALGERPLRHSFNRVPPNASVHADARTTRTGSNQQKLLIAAYPHLDQAGSTTKIPLKPADRWACSRVRRMWDVLKWQNGTLSIAWWALVAFALLVIIAAGSGAARR
jgi:hypothetical protein